MREIGASSGWRSGTRRRARTRRDWWGGFGARLSEWGKWNWPLLADEAGGGGAVVMVVVVLVTSVGAAAAVFVVGVPGKRRPLMLTVSRLLQWPHRTVTVLNRMLVGTLTCTHARTPSRLACKIF